MKDFKNLITNVGFELELSDNMTRFDTQNPHLVKVFIDKVKDEYAQELADNQDAQDELNALEQALSEFNALSANIGKDDLKEVYTLLKDRKLHPKGHFDKMGRFYLDDRELVDVNTPSVKYPYSEMNAGRTSKFVKAMADKYKVQSKDELLSLFTTKN